MLAAQRILHVSDPLRQIDRGSVPQARLYFGIHHLPVPALNLIQRHLCLIGHLEIGDRDHIALLLQPRRAPIVEGAVQVSAGLNGEERPAG